MRSIFVLFSFLVLAVFLITCGGGTVLVESTPRPEAALKTEPVAAPDGVFEIQVPQVEWTPATISSGLGDGLVRALADRKAVALVLSRSATPLLEDRVFQMIKAAAPETKVVARGRSTLDNLMEERGEIPYRTTMQPGGTDIMGRPYYLPKEHPLKTDWLTRKKPLKGAEAILAVRPIRADDKKLKRLREGKRGGCKDMEKALADSIDNGAEFFRPYNEAASEILVAEFARHLEVAMPYWRDELDQTAGQVEPGGPAARCVEEYRSLIDKYEPCLSGTCPLGPRLFIFGAGIIGLADSGVFIHDNCPAGGMRDYAAEIEDLAARVVSEEISSLDSGWASELARAGALSELKRGVEEACAPRHRRIDADELTAARVEVREFLTDLSSRELAGDWEPASGMERVPGVGPVRVLARVRVSGHNPVIGVGDLKKRLRKLDKCDDGGERLYQAVLIDVGSSEVLFMGIFFEEELLCDGFPPGSP
ncbi:MAG: hypothetical protein GY854_04190 [Deltaproteobacteria bacterium]|nr:hypothetical protein [Deltaproteobacteria bacterium]